MSDETDGLAIARRRIAQEAEERTGILDLGRLGLQVLPEELFSLKHLRALNLGSNFLGEDAKWRDSSPNIAPNELGLLERLSELSNLLGLFLRGCNLTSLAPLASLTALQTLDCS